MSNYYLCDYCKHAADCSATSQDQPKRAIRDDQDPVDVCELYRKKDPPTDK